MQHQPVFKLHPVRLPVEPPLTAWYITHGTILSDSLNILDNWQWLTPMAWDDWGILFHDAT